MESMMNSMVPNLVLLIVGLVVCFGGIYIRKFLSGVLGLVWGALVSALVLVILSFSGELSFTSEGQVAVTIIVAALLTCVLSIIFDRLSAAVNVFCNCAMIAVLAAFFSGESRETMQLILLVGAVLSAVVAGVAFAFYNVSYALATAFSGAFCVGVAGQGLISGKTFDRVLDAIFISNDSQDLLVVAAVTLVLGVIGFLVQMKRVKALKNKHRKKEKTIASTVAEKAETRNSPVQDDIIVPAPEFQDDLIVKQDDIPRMDDIRPPAAPSGKVRICPNCQKTFQNRAAFCSVCGGKTIEVCSRCGNPVKENAAFCGTCGNRMSV